MVEGYHPPCQTWLEWLGLVIKAYKLAVFEILGDFLVLPYIVWPRYPYIRVYRLYDSRSVFSYPY